MSWNHRFLTNLLIVPYGIETKLHNCIVLQGCLLIVPYGIETGRWRLAWLICRGLLIVPYGIETRDKLLSVSDQTAF